MKYIYPNTDWHTFRWRGEKIQKLLFDIKKAQGYLLDKMEALGFDIKNNALLQILTENIIKSSEIEGQILDKNLVRSSLAKRLGIDIGGEMLISRDIDGIAEMMLDATQNYSEKLSKERLAGWHAALFPIGYSCMHKISTGRYRADEQGAIQVVSGYAGNERVHYEVPNADVLEYEMNELINYINTEKETDYLIQAGIVHLWFFENLLAAINSSEEITGKVLQIAEFWQKHTNTVFNDRQIKVLNRFMDNFEGNLTTIKWAKMCNCSQDTANLDIKY